MGLFNGNDSKKLITKKPSQNPSSITSWKDYKSGLWAKKWFHSYILSNFLYVEGIKLENPFANIDFESKKLDLSDLKLNFENPKTHIAKLSEYRLILNTLKGNYQSPIIKPDVEKSFFSRQGDGGKVPDINDFIRTIDIVAEYILGFIPVYKKAPINYLVLSDYEIPIKPFQAKVSWKTHLWDLFSLKRREFYRYYMTVNQEHLIVSPELFIDLNNIILDLLEQKLMNYGLLFFVYMLNDQIFYFFFKSLLNYFVYGKFWKEVPDLKLIIVHYPELEEIYNPYRIKHTDSISGNIRGISFIVKGIENGCWVLTHSIIPLDKWNEANIIEIFSTDNLPKIDKHLIGPYKLEIPNFYKLLWANKWIFKGLNFQTKLKLINILLSREIAKIRLAPKKRKELEQQEILKRIQEKLDQMFLKDFKIYPDK